MSIPEAIVLGIIQGLTEFLPVSSSGHLEIGKHLLGVNTSESFFFSVAVHGATVLSTLAVFRKDIIAIMKDLFKFRLNEGTKFFLLIILSAIPVLFVGLFLKERVEALFDGNVVFVGIMLLVTALILFLSGLGRDKEKEISTKHALIIGLAQAIAVLPGISRSGATIGTGLLLGIKRTEIARFSFLMVIIPIVGANVLELAGTVNTGESFNTSAVVAGFIAAFITGYIACTWMINLIRKTKLVWFALYCALLGSVAIITGLLFL